jgi:hypothetical protein
MACHNEPNKTTIGVIGTIFATMWQEDLAQVFNPGILSTLRRVLKGRILRLANELTSFSVMRLIGIFNLMCIFRTRKNRPA